MFFNQGLKKIICITLIALLVFAVVPAIESNAAFTGLPIVKFIQNVQDMSQTDREWVRDSILNPLIDDSSLVKEKAKELKDRFPSTNISQTDIEAALTIFTITDSIIQQKVVNHLVAGKQSVEYKMGSFDTIRGKIEANVGSLQNLISALILMQDITGVDPIFTDNNASEGTIILRRTITGDMVGGDDVLEKLDETIQTITGVHFATLNLALLGYTELVNSIGTADERIKFEKFLFDYGSSSTEHLYEGVNAKVSNGGNTNVQPTNPPALEDDNSDTITAKTSVNADSNGNVNMSDEQIDKVLNNIDALAEKADAQDGNAETKLVIDVQAPNNLIQTNINIPSSIINEAMNKSIDLIEVTTSVAEITIPSSSLQVADATAVLINAKLVNKETELTPEQKAVVGDSPVYDFNITAVTSNGSTSIRNFAQGIQIAVPYTLKAGDNPENITVYYLNEKGELENMQARYDATTGTVTFNTTHLSKYYVKVNNVVFNDLAKYQWAKAYIESMAAKGIINGKDTLLFCPGDKLTRAEFASLLVKLFKIQDSGKTLTFKDVDKKAWYYNVVVSAVEQGIITGKDTETFAPNENISRQDMAVMIERVLKKFKKVVLPNDIKLDFADSNEAADYAKAGIAVAVKYGIIKGNEDNTFKPNNNVTRAEAAAVIYRIFNMK